MKQSRQHINKLFILFVWSAPIHGFAQKKEVSLHLILLQSSIYIYADSKFYYLHYKSDV